MAVPKCCQLFYLLYTQCCDIYCYYRIKPDIPAKTDDPGAGIMQMMQKMYDEGDDDMKRTLKKAWHESQEKKMKGDLGDF